LIGPENGVGRPVGHPAKLKNHEGISRNGNRTEYGMNLGQRDTKLGTNPSRETGQIGTSLDIQVIEKDIETPSG
jgi:hypothetical protein